MKTLDEVIKDIECKGISYCCYPQKDDCPYHCKFSCDDALHYLKEYKEKEKVLKIRMAEFKRGFEQLGIEWARIKDNPPLTWDELHEMEGKPIWVEEFFPVMEDETGATEDEGEYEKYWAIIDKVDPKKIYITWHNGNFQSLPLLLMDETWQAYRKERE